MGELEEIRGRWEKSGDQSQWYDVHEMSEALEFAGVDTSTIKDDAEFIAHAPEDMRRLLNAVEAVLAYGVDRENYTNTGNAEVDAAIRSYAYHVRRVITTALEAS